MAGWRAAVFGAVIAVSLPVAAQEAPVVGAPASVDGGTTWASDGDVNTEDAGTHADTDAGIRADPASDADVGPDAGANASDLAEAHEVEVEVGTHPTPGPSESPRPSTASAAAPLVAPEPSDAMKTRHRRNRVTWGPLPLVLGWIPLEYERAIAEKVSLYVGPQLKPTAGLALLAGTVSWGGRLSLGARFFPLGGAPDGFWVAGEVVPSYEFTRGELEGATQVTRSASLFGLGMVGYSFIGGNGLTFSAGLGLGGGYNDAVTETEGRLPDTSRGFIPSFAVHLNVGWAF